MKIKQFFLLNMVFTLKSLFGLDQYSSSEKASFYHHHSQQQWTVAQEALKKVYFKKGWEKVLDIGCGSGKISASIAGRIPQGSVVGLDISQGMIAFAQKNYLPFYSNLSFIQSDILEFNILSRYDIIFSANSLHWVLDHESLLKKVFYLLQDEGTILFTIPCTAFPEVATVFQEVLSQDDWKPYLKDYHHPRRKFTSEEYTSLLEKAGFTNIEVIQVPFTHYFETKREFADWYAGFASVFFYIPAEMHEFYLTTLVERYLESFPLDEMGRMVLKQNELIIKAQKPADTELY